MGDPITTQPLSNENSAELAESALGLEDSRRNRVEQFCCNVWDCVKGTFYTCIDVCCEDECCCCRKYFTNRRLSRRNTGDDDDDDNNMWVNDNALPMIEEQPKSVVTNSTNRNSSQQVTIHDSGDKSDDSTLRVDDRKSVGKNRNSTVSKNNDESAITDGDSHNHSQNSDRDDSKQVEESIESATHEGNHTASADACDGAADSSGNDLVD